MCKIHIYIIGNLSFSSTLSPAKLALSLKEGKDLENNDHEKIFNFILTNFKRITIIYFLHLIYNYNIFLSKTIIKILSLLEGKCPERAIGCLRIVKTIIFNLILCKVLDLQTMHLMNAYRY